MACCKPCCGCQDCSEGQEGKCCCGGQSGNCCSDTQYCCNGACQDEECAACSGTCEVAAEVVYFANTTGAHLQLDGDSFPVCTDLAALPEVISGSFTLGTPDGCAGHGCGCELKFRFWRNLYSTCDGSNGMPGGESDIVSQTVEIECTAGAVTVHTLGGDYVLNSGDSHTFFSIELEPSNGPVAGSAAGECFSVSATSATASFSVTAALDWSNGTDHDLYGEVSCGACA